MVKDYVLGIQNVNDKGSNQRNTETDPAARSFNLKAFEDNNLEVDVSNKSNTAFLNVLTLPILLLRFLWKCVFFKGFALFIWIKDNRLALNLIVHINMKNIWYISEIDIQNNHWDVFSVLYIVLPFFNVFSVVFISSLLFYSWREML